MKTIHFIALSFALLSLSCAKNHASKSPEWSATSQIQARSGSQVSGVVTFLQTSPNEISISGKIEGLKPNSKHGFHIHEKGDCSAADAMSAGLHFNPTQKDHGSLEKESHAGDLGNLITDDNGEAEFTVAKRGVSLADTKTSFVGKSVIIHDKEDDLTTQPTGNAGGRIGCGVIVKNKTHCCHD